MATFPGTIGFGELASSPSTPPAGYALIYLKTDNVLYIKDSSGTEVALGSASSITSLTGDVTASGPGAAAATVVSVGGASAANIATAVAAYLAATSANTPNTIVKRDGSGNFIASVITAALNGNANTATTAGSATNFTGSLSGDVTGTQSATVVSTVGGSSASNIHSAELAANAATSTNTSSTIVKRDASGNFSANIISASLNGNATTSTNSTNFTGSLSGDVTGTQSATVVASVGGSSASNIHSAELAANAATSSNTASTIVERDASGNFSANIITANLTGNASGTASNVTGIVAIANGGTNSSTSLNNNRIIQSSTGKIVEAAAITAHRALVSDSNGIPTQSVTTDTELSYVSGVTSSIQTQINSITGSGITSLTGDVTASGPGAAAATVVSVGGSSAANIHTAELAANAATSSNTPSTIVKRDASGNFSAGTITANLTGNVSGSSASFTGPLLGDVTGNQSTTNIAKIQGTTVSGTTGSGNVVFSTSPTLTGTLNGAAANFSGAISASNLSGTNTGDVSVTDTNSIDLTLTGQNIQADLKLSSDAADASNLKATTTIHSGAGAGLHVELPFAVPVQIGTSNAIGSSSSISLSDHVHSHGNQTVATLHAVATGGANGFMSSTDKTKLDASTDANTPSTLVMRDASGNFSAGTITANLTGTATNATNATTAVNFTGSLSGDITGTQSATLIPVGTVTDTKSALAVKPAVTVVATTNQALTGTPTIDGQATASGSLILLSAQSTASQNGPWVAAAGAWSRPTWYPNGGTSQAFQFITTFVRLGTTYGGSVWRQTAAAPITIDTTATTWVVTPTSGNYKSAFTLGPASGSVDIQLNFSNAFVGTLAWNPTASYQIKLPPTQGAAGTFPSNDGSGNLTWTNPVVNIDGGAANSNYTSSQLINGGTA